MTDDHYPRIQDYATIQTRDISMLAPNPEGWRCQYCRRTVPDRTGQGHVCREEHLLERILLNNRNDEVTWSKYTPHNAVESEQQFLERHCDPLAVDCPQCYRKYGQPCRSMQATKKERDVKHAHVERHIAWLDLRGKDYTQWVSGRHAFYPKRFTTMVNAIIDNQLRENEQ
jgi:hypothetical protein